MNELYARLSKAGRVVCGRPDIDGRLSCDEPLAAIVTVDGPRGREARLVPLAGWRQDRKSVWRRTTRAEDLKARGLATRTALPPRGHYPDLPALACCPKCKAVQWLDAERLKVSGRPNARGAPVPRPSRFRLTGGHGAG